MLIFAKGLNLDKTQPAIWSSLNIDCCTTNGVSCTSQRVVSINWSGKGLNGWINGTAVPQTVTFLDISVNQLNGSIPTNYPNAIATLYNDVNRLTGSIPSTLPSSLLDFWVDGNNLSGEVPIFPASLVKIALGYPGYPGNRFTGVLRMNRPIRLWINNNWITDVIIQDISQISYSQCDFSDNPLLGNPNIAGLACTKNNLYSPSTLPNTLSTTKAAVTQIATNPPSYISSQLLSTPTTNPWSAVLTSTTSIFPMESSQTSTEYYISTPDHTTTIYYPTSFDRSVSKSNNDFSNSTFLQTESNYSSITIIPTSDHFPILTHVMTIAELIKLGIKLLVDTALLAIVLNRMPIKRGLCTIFKSKKEIASFF